MKKILLYIICFSLTACLGVQLEELPLGVVETKPFVSDTSREINIVTLDGQLEFSDVEIQEKGFLISLNRNDLDINENLEMIRLKVFNQSVEGFFDTTYTLNKSNEQYFYTAYAIFKNGDQERKVQGVIENITYKNGWIQSNSIENPTENLSFGRRGGVGAAIDNNKALIALGCQNNNCNSNFINSVHIYELEFEPSINENVWQNKSKNCEVDGRSFFNSRGGISFILDEKFYFGLGLFDVGSAKSEFIDKLYCFDPASCQLDTFKVPNNFGLREGAIAFDLKGKAYIGFGRDDSNLMYFSDLWEFDPKKENPFTILFNSLAYPELKRYNAVSFSIGDFGYIGLGRTAVDNRKDFVKFDPLGGINGTTFFETITDFDEALFGAVAFVIEDDAFVGLGQQNTNEYNTEFWRFNPAVGWENTGASFPGEGRREAIGFSLSNKGFVGTGWNGINTFNDFWIYIP